MVVEDSFSLPISQMLMFMLMLHIVTWQQKQKFTYSQSSSQKTQNAYVNVTYDGERRLESGGTVYNDEDRDL
jgi:hypothetical protein